MHLSIVGPTIAPAGAVGGDGSGFDKTGDQMLHPLDRSCRQSNPHLVLYRGLCGELITSRIAFFFNRYVYKSSHAKVLSGMTFVMKLAIAAAQLSYYNIV